MDGLVTKEMFTKGGLVTEMFTLVNFQNFRKEKSLPTLPCKLSFVKMDQISEMLPSQIELALQFSVRIDQDQEIHQGLESRCFICWP